MEILIHCLVILPFAAFLLSLFISSKREDLLSIFTFLFLSLELLISLILFALWIKDGALPINIKEFSIYQNGEYNFYIDLYFDKLTMLFVFIGSFLTFIVTMFSRYYLHREEGYKRFFNTILFFFSGFIMVIFSGNIETLFIG